MKYFNNRTTIRNYSSKIIDNELLNDMLEAAAHAPTTGGMQLYSVIVTENEEMKQRLMPCHFNQPMVAQAPVVLTFCADFNRFVKWCQQRDAEPGFDNLQSLMSAILDVTIFAQQFNTIAEMQGLGCCYIGTTAYNAKEIAEVLHLPRLVVPIITLTVGYPDESVQPVATERLPLHGIVHHETYQDYCAHDIDEIYAEKESLPVNQGFVKENNKQTLAQVFTDVRYPKAVNEEFAKRLYDYIKAPNYCAICSIL